MTNLPPGDDRVSRRRYARERSARQEAERLLEERALALFHANAELKRQAETLEEAVRRRTEELEAAKQAAEKASAAKSAFLAMISHEIRTPLNGVLGMATALADTELEANQRDMLDVIVSSGNGLLALLNDVLDLSKIEARRLTLETIEFDPNQLMDEVVALHRANAAEKGLDLLIAGHLPQGRWRGDPNRLRQVVSNLLSNAVKFTACGHVSLDMRMIGDRLEVAVSDTGAGVPEETRPKLFKPFSQADTSITREFGGTGLGLAISRRICRMMGGDLTFHPAPGGGACFVATVHLLPLRSGAAAGPDRACPYQRVLTERRWRILAAEDGATNRKVLDLLLRPLDLDLSMAVNGAEAVAAHRATPFDLILMDVNMPVMDGLQAADAIRAAERAEGLPRVPIIALTANAMTHEVSDYSRHGIDAHVSKPVRREELAQAMAMQLCVRLRARVEDRPQAE